MPSSNNLIQSLRSAHDPHFKLEGRVGGLEKGLGIQVAQLHKTMSKSFGMQRKTLARVLGLESRLSNLETAIEIWTTREGLRRKQEAEARAVERESQAVQEAVAEAEAEVEAVESQVVEAVNNQQRGGTAGVTATKKKPKKKPKIKLKKKPKIKGKKRKITGKDLKKGTALETPEERAKRIESNRQESVAGEEHQKTDEFKETTSGIGGKGEYLSAAERKRRFKLGKLLPPAGGVSPEDVNPQAEMGSDEGKKDRIVQFLNVDVKDKLEEINDSLVEIKGVVTTQGDLADDRDESLRESILSDKKKQREKDLEKKKGPKDKMLESVTKPVGNFLNKLIKFVMMTFVGSVVNRVMTLLKDPAQLLDPIKRFFNLVIGLVNAVMKGLWNVTGAPMNFIIGGINSGVSLLLDAINKATGLLKIPPIPAPKIPTIPGPPQFDYIPLSKTAQEKNEGVAMAGGGLVPGYENGGVVTDPEEKKQQEAYMLKFVNEERALQGLEPLTDLTYAPGVELTKAIGPGPRIEEQSNTNIDLDKGITSKIKSRTVDGKTSFAGEIGQSTDEERQQFFAENPHASQLLNLKNQAELDNLGADISSSAKPKKFNMGGKVPGSGTGDTVPAMLTPGEFVMSKGAVDKIGTDNLMAMNAAGGGTNVPKMMKFAGGGIVPGIDAPSGRGGKVVVIGGGGGSSAPRGVASSGSSGESRRFSSTDPNNVTIPVVKSLYNIMS